MNRNEFFTAAFSGSPFDGVDKAPPEFMYAPAGQHFVCGDRDGETTMLHVLVDPSTVANLNSALKAHQARGLKPYFDFNHAEAEASAWPTEFCWKDGASPGVYVKCAWSDPGNAAITGKSWRTFSPAIVPDKWMSDEKNPSKIIGSPLIMGGLVNNPAFKKIAPLWAKNKESNPMQKTADELQADLAAAQTEISTLKAAAKILATDGDADVLKAKNKELEDANLKLAAAEKSLKARNGEVAETCVKAAQARGALPLNPGKDSAEDKLICRWRERITLDPSDAELLNAVPGAVQVGGSYLTASRRQEVTLGEEDINRVCVQYIKAMEKDQDLYPYMTGKGAKKFEAKLEAPRIYKDAIQARLADPKSSDAVMRCANALGTLAGVLVVQRRLDLLKYEFPEINRCTTDFSAEPVDFNQQITTRTTTPQAASRYVAPTYVNNAPAGGYVDNSVADTDVIVTINQHGYVQFTFTANDLASTKRLLFPEQEEGMHFSMGYDLVNTLLALVTPAAFPGQPGGGAGTAAMAVPGSTVATPDQMNRQVVIAMKAALNQRGAILGKRTLLLNEQYHAALESDTTIVGNLINKDSGEAIATSRLPKIAQFDPYEAPYLPAANNLVGFGFRQDALVMACRLPNDYSKVFPGVTGGGVTQIVTNPDTGLSVVLTMFIDHRGGSASMRIAYMFGVAVGNPLSGQLLVS